MSREIGFFESGLPLKMALCLLVDGILRNKSEVALKQVYIQVASQAYRDYLADKEAHELTVAQVEKNYQLVLETLDNAERECLMIKARGMESTLFSSMLVSTMFDPATEAGLREVTKAYMGRMVNRNRCDPNYWVDIEQRLLFLLYSPQFFDGPALHPATFKIGWDGKKYVEEKMPKSIADDIPNLYRLLFDLCKVYPLASDVFPHLAPFKVST